MEATVATAVLEKVETEERFSSNPQEQYFFGDMYGCVFMVPLNVVVVVVVAVAVAVGGGGGGGGKVGEG